MSGHAHGPYKTLQRFAHAIYGLGMLYQKVLLSVLDSLIDRHNEQPVS
jgi:hypothetical protein